MMSVAPNYHVLFDNNCFAQQTTANAEQLRVIEERVESLHVLASAADDWDDDERRGGRSSEGTWYSFKNYRHFRSASAIYRKLAGVVAKLRPLSEQNELAKFLRNAENADLLSGFVQDLTYAVADYQVRGVDYIALTV
jgi:hypothetical protein